MSECKRTRMARQLQLYDIVATIAECGAVYNYAEINDKLGIPLRMFERDLNELRDCGLIKLKFNRVKDCYVTDGEAVFDESSKDRRRAHLIRLYRLGTLVRKLSRTRSTDLERYESGLKYYAEYVEDVKDDPENNSPEDLRGMYEFYVPQDFHFYDLKAEYYALFPGSNERTRQRDFKELQNAGFNIYYSREYRSFVFEEYVEEE